MTGIITVLLVAELCLLGGEAHNSMSVGTCRMVCDQSLPDSAPSTAVTTGAPGKRGQRGPDGVVGPKGQKGETAEACVCPRHDSLQGQIDDLNTKLKKIHSPEDCREVVPRNGSQRGGVYTIYPQSWNGYGVELYCDTTTDGGGWMVFQRRMDGSVDFYRDWADYANGFGNPNGEFWLGLKHIHKLVQHGQYELRVDLEDFDGNTRYAEYSSFTVGDAESFYSATTSGYSGTAGNCLQLTNQAFSTNDQDHDTYSKNCAEIFKGAMWYASCHCTNPNGLYLKGHHDQFAVGVNWSSWKGQHYSLKFVEMKIRKID